MTAVPVPAAKAIQNPDPVTWDGPNNLKPQ